LGQGFGKARRALRRIELQRRVDVDQPLAQAVLEEALQARDAARGAGGPSSPRSQKGEKVGLRDVGKLLSRKGRELLQVGAVGLPRVARQPVLGPERVAERV